MLNFENGSNRPKMYCCKIIQNSNATPLTQIKTKKNLIKQWKMVLNCEERKVKREQKNTREIVDLGSLCSKND